MQNDNVPKKGIFYSLRKTLLFVFSVALIFSIGYGVGLRGYYINYNSYPKVTIDRQPPADKKDIQFSMFWNVWDTLNAKYYDKSKLIPAQMVYGAIKGMVAAVGDPYTSFLPPKENKVVEEDLSGSFEGVGIQIGYIKSQLAVVAPLPDSPAEAAGVKAGDYIVGIKDDTKKIDTSTTGMDLNQAVQIIRGPKGSVVTLSLVREGSDKPIIVDITRDTLTVPSVSLKFVGENENIADLRISKFAAETEGEWNDKVYEVLQKKDLAGIIIDVRNNPGGYLQAAVDLASDFLEMGDTVVIEENGDGSKDYFKVERLGKLRDEKVVMLVNKGSASASEILSGALRDQKKVPLIGETTFGKGTIQEPEQLEDGSGLHITIAKWLTPSEFWVNEKGLEPDVSVEDNPDTPEDEQLNAAIQQILSK